MTKVEVPPTVSSELETAVYDDWKRQAVDSAKKRAVAQLADYETFKNMVSVAHLRPIGAETSRSGEKAYMNCRFGWPTGRALRHFTALVSLASMCQNAGISVTTAALVGRDGSIISDKRLQDNLPGGRSDEIATTGIDFRKAWRRSHTTKEARRKYLERYNPQQLKKVFKVEIDSLLLSEIIDVLVSGLQMQDGQSVAADAAKEPFMETRTSSVEEYITVFCVLNAVRHARNFGICAQLLPRSILTKLTGFFQDTLRRCEASDKWMSLITQTIGDRTNLVQLAKLFRVEIP